MTAHASYQVPEPWTGFQSFDETSNPDVGQERCASLRAWLKAHQLDGFLIPRSDENQGEYVPPHAERLAWLTGFTGSAGLAIILQDEASIFVDGRYTIQVKEQVDTNVFTPRHLIEEPPRTWLTKTLTANQTLAYDPWLHTISEVRALRKAAEDAGAQLVPVDNNAIDEIWMDQPTAPIGPVVAHPLSLAGEDSATKLKTVSATLTDKGADATVFTQPDSIAWLLNIRGSDVPHTPLPLSFAILQSDGTLSLFIHPDKLNADVRATLPSDVSIHAPSEFNTALMALGDKGATVLLDPAWVAEAINSLIENNGGTIVAAPDLCLLPKARKNAVEVEGARQAHIRDGIAYARFLAWFDRALAAEESLTEISVAKMLETIRAASGALKDISFDTISAAGPHGAITHYRVTHKTDLPLTSGPAFLLDSGAQYEDGTTDITRTLAIGAPDDELCTRNTLVLKGMIAVTMARFPKGITGGHLDSLARMPLWQNGLDFDHGTGHGVGSYLSVHEGPQRISRTSTVPLESGMILSNEPGYYKENAYGIRIENLIVVRDAELVSDGDRPMFWFETLTLAPIDRRLIKTELLTEQERDWLNAYHARVLDIIGPHLNDADTDWLKQATAPL